MGNPLNNILNKLITTTKIGFGVTISYVRIYH